jgi:1,3-beta-glucan synthase
VRVVNATFCCGQGALGDFAASSELAFGTLLQSTMASVLQSRYHYGHPDMFDKFSMVAQVHALA